MYILSRPWLSFLNVGAVDLFFACEPIIPPVTPPRIVLAILLPRGVASPKPTIAPGIPALLITALVPYFNGFNPTFLTIFPAGLFAKAKSAPRLVAYFLAPNPKLGSFTSVSYTHLRAHET